MIVNKKYINAVNNDKTIFNNKFLVISNFILSFILCLVPLVLLNDNLIRNNMDLKLFADNGGIFFPNIESIAISALSYDLYYYSKFQLTWVVLSSIIVFILSVYILGKIYLYNLGYISANKNRYENIFIKDRGYQSSNIFSYFMYLLFVLILLEFILFKYFNLNTTYFHDLLSSKFSIFCHSVLVCSLISFYISYFLVESLALIRVSILKILKN